MLPLLLQPRPMAIEAAAPVLFAAARHVSSAAAASATRLFPRADPAAAPPSQQQGGKEESKKSEAPRQAAPLSSSASSLLLRHQNRRRPLFFATTFATTTTAPTTTHRPAADLLAEAHAIARQPPAAALPQLRALAPELAAACPHFPPSQLAALLPALARTGLSDRAFRDAACAALLARLDDLAPSELSDAAFALARGLGHDHQLLAAVVDRAARDPSAFCPASLSKILWACARLSYAHDALPALLEQVVEACCGAPESATAVAELAFAAGTLDWADDRLHDALATYARTHPKVFDGHAIAKLLSGLVGVGVDDAPLFGMLAERAAELAARGELAPSDAARLCWALGEGEVWSPVLMNALSRHMLEGGLDAFSASELQMIVRAANKLGFCSPAVAAAAARLTDRLLPCLEPLPADDDGRTPGVSPPSPGSEHWTPMSAPPPPPHHHHP